MMSHPMMQLTASSMSVHARVHSLMSCNIACLVLTVNLNSEASIIS